MAQMFGIKMSKEELLKRVGSISQLAAIKPYEMSEGRSQGLKAFDVTTGSGLAYTLLEGKCLDISNMSYKGINLSFMAKPGLVSPGYLNPQTSEFVRSFQGGMLYTCGLSNVGSPCSIDGVQYNQHGRIGSIPAENVSTRACWENDEYITEISGEMRECALFGENLLLRRTVTSRLGGKSIEIHDTVENQGFDEQALMILYHFNFGYPFLDENVRILIPDTEAVPRDEEAKKGIGGFTRFGEPEDGFAEQVFYHSPASLKDGSISVGIINDNLEMGAYIRYNLKQLPRLVEWKSLRSGDYALGIEPSNCFVEGRAREMERGTLKTLKPFEKVAFDLEIGIIDGKTEIQGFEKYLKA